MPVVGRSVGPPVIWRKEGGKRGESDALFFRGTQDEDCWFCSIGTAVVNAPGRQKAVAAFWERVGVPAVPGAVIAW